MGSLACRPRHSPREEKAMTISSQWLAFGAIGIALFIVGIVWPKGQAYARDEREKDADSGEENEPASHRRGAAALAQTR